LGELSEADFWGFEIEPADFDDGPALFEVPLDASAVVHVFVYLRELYATAATSFGGAGQRLAIWMGENLAWNCGVCVGGLGHTVRGYPFDVNMFQPTTTENEEQWNTSTHGHEFGHYVMRSYSKSPDEGGTHCLGATSRPGLGWSEGFASWFSLMYRDTPILFGKQGGTFFWFSVPARGGEDAMWPLPSPDGGLHQDIYELEITAMLWDIATALRTGDGDHANWAEDHGAFVAGLVSDRMKRYQEGRGYTVNRWEHVNCYPDTAPCDRELNFCVPVDVQETEYSRAVYPDYLDALRCRAQTLADEERQLAEAVANPPQERPLEAARVALEQAIRSASDPGGEEDETGYPYPIDEPPVCYENLGLTCLELDACRSPCGDNMECLEGCTMDAREDAIAAYAAVLTCFRDAQEDGCADNPCVQAFCAAQISACLTNN